MNMAFVLEYVKRRMCDDHYAIRLRHLTLQGSEERVLNVNSGLFILIDIPSDIRVESSIGIFDLSEDMINELQYEHKGDIKVTNLSIFLNHVRFIQIIPQKKDHASHN